MMTGLMVTPPRAGQNDPGRMSRSGRVFPGKPLQMLFDFATSRMRVALPLSSPWRTFAKTLLQ